jgi:hypothetical protein
MRRRTRNSKKPLVWCKNELHVIDPDNVPETWCDGQINMVVINGNVAITFTCARSAPGPLLAQGKIEFEVVVRARILMSSDQLKVLVETGQAILAAQQTIQGPNEPAKLN